MAKSEQRRQNKLAKKQAKERRKHKEASRRQQLLASLAGKMTAAARGRIIYCGVTEDVRTQGIGYVCIARQALMGEVAVALILVDTYCLGVKNALGTLRSASDAKAMIEDLQNQFELQTVSPGLARGLVEGAIGYARSIGFEPHADYRKVAPIWGDTQAESVAGQYEFGKDGKPFYVSGPFDDLNKQQFINKTLERTVGPGNYHFIVTLGPRMGSHFESYDAEDFDDEEDSDEDLDEGVAENQLLENTIDAPEYRRIDPEHS